MHPKGQNYYFFAMSHFDCPSQKNDDILKLPKHMHFLPIWNYGGVIPRNILNKHFTPLHCLNKTFILNFVHHHFLPKLLQELRYLL
jgi:hypothetical protein